jgi:hypothetical protein
MAQRRTQRYFGPGVITFHDQNGTRIRADGAERRRLSRALERISGGRLADVQSTSDFLKELIRLKEIPPPLRRISSNIYSSPLVSDIRK